MNEESKFKTKVLTTKNPLGFKVLTFGRTGSGKTDAIISLAQAGQKVRFLAPDNNSMAGILSGFSRRNLKIEDFDFSIGVPERPVVAGKDILDMIDSYLKTDIDVLMKTKDKNRKSNVGFRNIYAGAIEFTDTLTGENKGMVTDWGVDTTLVIDSLTVVCDEIRLTVTGNKPSTLPEWGSQQSLLKSFINHTTAVLKCNVVLLAHPTKEVDPITSATTIYPLNIGQALNESFSSNFSDVLYSQFDGKNYFWSTKHRTAVCSGRNVDIADNLPQDYRQFFNRTA